MKVKIVVLGIIIGIALIAQTSRTVWDGVYTDDQAKRGEGFYGKECASCHGGELTGGESAPPLAGDSFFANWNGLTLGDLFDRIRTTMPLNAPSSLGRERYADILAFVLKSNGYPAGQRDLDRRSDPARSVV